MFSLLQDLRFAVRALCKAPAFALTVVATLAIGIGLNAAIFTVVDCVLLRPLGYHDADRIAALRTHFDDENRSIAKLGGDDYNDIARDVKGLEATAYYQAGTDGIRINGTALYLPVANVSPGFGAVMGVEPVAGRVFSSNDRQGTEALVSAAFAREHFGSARAALGQQIQYAGIERPIIGVLPDGFSFPGKSQVWIEENAAPRTANRTSYSQSGVAKRRAGVSKAQLAAELATFSHHLQSAYPEDHYKTLEFVPLQEQIVGKIRSTIFLLMGSVAVILLIVCANVTHLQLVRATRNLRATTIRTALGASRLTLAGRALLEAALLAIAGSAAAVLLAMPALRLLVRIAPPNIPRLADVRLNLDVLLFSFLISLLLMSLTAVLPVWRSWHIDPASALRSDASRGTEGRGSRRLRNGLIVAEVALTLTLSVGAVLLARQLIAQSQQDLGFAADNLITLDGHAVDSATPPANATPAETEAFEANLSNASLARLHATLDSIAAVPGVKSVSAIDGAPMGFGGSDVGYAVHGRQVFAPPFHGLPDANIRAVTTSFLATMQIPLLSGRALNEGDRLGAPPVLLINRELARRIFPNQNPIGQQIMCGYDAVGAWWTLVGVVGDVRENSPAAEPYPTFYIPIAQHPGRASDVQFVVRTQTNPTAMLETLRKLLQRTHPETAIHGTTMRENIGATQQSERFRTTLFTLFAAVSILLAAIGIYGVTAYTVAQRRFEFGLRFALGATRAQVLTLVLGNAATVTALGIAAGVVLSLALTRLVANVAGKLPGFDPFAYTLAAAVILAIALVATLLPARRAASVEPMTVLRGE